MLILACLPAQAEQARSDQTGQLGVGLIAGSPIGVTMKYWLDSDIAFDGGAGYGNAGVFYADVLFNNWSLVNPPRRGRTNTYLGAGPRVATDDGGQFALRAMAGIGYWPAGQPIEIFAEVGPTFKITPDNKVGIDGGLGLRYYFNVVLSPVR